MFMHPLLFAVGLCGAAIPLIVHWLTRPRPVRMPLSTIRLVSDALHERRAKQRLRDFLVLLMRCLAVALLAMAIARPLLVGDRRPAVGDQADRVKIVLLDASQSMAAIDGAATRFDSGRAAAATELSYKPNLAANLLVASHQAGAVFDSPSANLQLLRDRLAESKVSASAFSPAIALEEVTRQFATSDADAERELVVISDFQRSNWARADFSALPEKTKVRLISLSKETALANLAIEAVRLSATPTAGKPVTMLVDVVNHSPDTRSVQCQLELSQLTRVVEGTLQPQSRSTLQMTVDWPGAGWQWGKVRLLDTGDAIAADDELPVAIGVRPETKIAIVTEAKRASKSGAFFIRQAFSLRELDREEDASDDSIVTVTPGMLDTPTAQSARLWVITDVEAWDDSVAPRVAAWLRRGRAVLYFARGPADANNLRRLKESLGTDMQPAVELVASLESDRRRDLRVDVFDRQNPPFSAFGDTLATTASSWRFGGGSPTRAVNAGSIDSVAATLSDRSALLFFTDVGAGKLAVFNADLTASNVAYQAGFVPVLVETVARLTDDGGAVAGTPSGQPIVRDLPGDAGDPDALTIVRASKPSSDDDTAVGKIRSQDGLLVWNWTAATEPDVYRVTDKEDRTVWAEAVRTDPAEQDLRSLSQEVLQQRLSGGRKLAYETSAQASGQTDSLWVYATLAMLGCIVAEMGTLLWFRA